MQGPAEKISRLLLVAVKFTFYGPALVVSLAAVILIAVATGVMRRTVAVEALSMNA